MCVMVHVGWGASRGGHRVGVAFEVDIARCWGACGLGQSQVRAGAK